MIFNFSENEISKMNSFFLQQKRRNLRVNFKLMILLLYYCVCVGVRNFATVAAGFGAAYTASGFAAKASA